MIAATHLLDDISNPRNPPDSQAHGYLDKLPSGQLKTYGIKDLPVKRGKVTPVEIFHSIVAAATSSSDTRTQHVFDLVQLLFYFCLQYC